MKQVIAIALLLAAFGIVKQIFVAYESAQREEWAAEHPQDQVARPPEELPGLPASLESSLETARNAGADGLGAFLNQYRHAIRDPRLAEIELDYVVLVSHKNSVEARYVFNTVQQRTRESSPLFARVNKLKAAYQ